ncbi:MAG TPA: class I SAM-dependent methyltransferase [Steroidobacteraceae bacterium]|nr:class I SAM-dependent methyltransferase [Steroidobacteraceae bacterium]
MRKRSKYEDPSSPLKYGIDYASQFYRSKAVAEDYDFHRFSTPERQRRNARKWAAIESALDYVGDVHAILDLPCGTGRFTGALARRGHEVVGSDISLEMIRQAARAPGAGNGAINGAINGYVQADGGQLPFCDGAFDCVVAIRFTLHIEPEPRVRILREFHRVARRWLIIDYRHCYTFRYPLRRARWKLGLARKPLVRVSRRELEEEFRRAGFTLRKIVRVSWPLFSDKWIAVGERVSA